MKIAILEGETSVEGKRLKVEAEQDYSSPIDCLVRPDETNFTAILQWKHNHVDDVPSRRQTTTGVYQVYEDNMQRLYIKSVNVSADGLYTCGYAASDGSTVSKSFVLNVFVGKCLCR